MPAKMNEFRIERATQSRIDQVNFNNIPFGRVFTDHMFVADYDGKEWTNMRIIPFEEMRIHPGILAWHYGQEIFEGMKASKSVDGTPFLFRPELHAQRMNASARRMSMPEIPEEIFLGALHKLVQIDQAWIPPQPGSALYIRPLMIATDEFIGVRASEKYMFMIMCLPVGPYYSKPVSLLVEEKYVRAAPGGVGAAKTAGNYAASLYPAKLAKEKGYDQVMWMDAREFKYVQEVGTMNIFFVIDGVVVTPETSDTILKGITRDSFLKILDQKGIPYEERPVSIDEIVESHRSGKLTEVFGSGTAAVVAKVERIGYRGDDMVFDMSQSKVSGMLYDYINALRQGTQKDHWGWIVPVKQEVLAS